MKTSHFSFDLPDRLIAQKPPEKRGLSRLMVVERETGELSHCRMTDLPELLPKGALVVFNDSRVRKARLFGTAEKTGGKVEFFLLEKRPEGWLCLVSKAKKQRSGKAFLFPGGMKGEILGEEGARRLVRFCPEPDEAYLDEFGHMPLPPYIKRDDSPEDAERYQTVYARISGSTAAPTAGLHFTEELLKRMEDGGIETAFVTLHVGLGTFQPIRTEMIHDHEMHREDFSISQETAEKVNRAKGEGRPVVCVGTTSVRALESAWQEGDEHGGVRPGTRSTNLFIYPGYRFKAADQIFTNFHTPESTLLILVSAFAGKELIDRAYEAAVEEEYRFFSYGDAMYIR